MIRRGDKVLVAFFREGGVLSFFLGVCYKESRLRLWLKKDDGLRYTFLVASPRVLCILKV